MFFAELGSKITEGKNRLVEPQASWWGHSHYITNSASLIHGLNSAMDKGTEPSEAGFKPCH